MANKFVLNQEDGTVEGGNIRGSYAVDLQMLRSSADQVASGNYSVILGGTNNKIALGTSNHNAIVGGFNNQILSNAGNRSYNYIGGGYNNIINDVGNGNSNTLSGGFENTITGERSVIGGGINNVHNNSSYSTISGGRNNVSSSAYNTISGGSNNTASTNTYATVVGGQGNSSTGQYSISGGYSNVASRLGAVALGYDNTASGHYSTAFGYDNNVSGVNGVALGKLNTSSGNSSFSTNESNTASGLLSSAFGWSTISSNKASISTGVRSRSYIETQFSQSNNRFANNGDQQSSFLTRGKQDTLITGATTTVASDLIPDGTNRGWNVTIKSIATVTAITGTATGVNVGDMFIQDDKILFKKISNTSSIVNSSNSQTIFDTSMSTALMSYSVGGSQDLQIDFISPSFTGGGSVTYRVVSKIELVEVAF